MFCSNCGAQVADGASFCPKCGTPLGASQQAAPIESAPVEVTPVEVAPVEVTRVEVPLASENPQEVVTPLVTPQAPPAQPAQYVPQPVSAEPPTSGVSTQPAYAQQQAPQQASYASQQPTQQSYGYQPAQQQSYGYQPTGQAAASAKKKAPIAAIVIGAIVALALVFVVVSHLMGGSGSGSGSSGSGGSTPIVQVPDINTGSVTMLDSKGNPTVAGITSQPGAALVAALENEGWKWDDDKLWFVSSDSNDAFYVYGANDYEYTYEEISALAADGAGEPVVYVMAVDDRDYSSASATLSSVAGMTFDDTQWLDDELGMASFTDAAGNRGIVLVDYNDDPGLYVVNVFNQEAISQGVIDEWLGDNYGRSVDEIWETVFG